MKIGMLGGGQLARMLALAGIPLGCEFTIFSPDREACAAPLGRSCCYDYSDAEALMDLAASSDVIGFEFENVPVRTLDFLADHLPVRPGPEALRLAQDRVHEKELFTELDIPCAAFFPVDSLEDLHRAAALIGLPAVLKARRQGYDGRGQTLIRQMDEMAPAWQLLGGQPAILESLVDFDREISVIAVRAASGETAFYALSENTHHHGILRLAVSQPHDSMQAQAERYAQRLLDRLDYVGVLALELFQAGDHLLANEYAPRVHNSGHWTIEGAATSQFENHLRAIMGLPLGSTALRGVAATINLIGTVPDMARILGTPNTCLHLYGKACKPGRKLGHVTVCADSMKQLNQILSDLSGLFSSEAVSAVAEAGHYQNQKQGGCA
ncbi:5-(carboxyamino)imidazole ribonucleotide synthase [Desulfobotulus mexicanus]|uniref:N5-carboxyaminoimidazole ribonucleotide synthase n=1 Tax=Desulfobotulus mexicanus TaxID=2586642 RepID=A0A5Q4VGI5_9BACT|nr:5-(carboxyamino)imidazole ribonucleotide synthase [Desulfobotulus mexicanus]TYT76048.1 5-(carboxyamino)imidazole ribonucleotide synthase [Desulfobotulus mexicanus]